MRSGVSLDVVVPDEEADDSAAAVSCAGREGSSRTGKAEINVTAKENDRSIKRKHIAFELCLPE